MLFRLLISKNTDPVRKHWGETRGMVIHWQYWKLERFLGKHCLFWTMSIYQAGPETSSSWIFHLLTDKLPLQAEVTSYQNTQFLGILITACYYGPLTTEVFGVNHQGMHPVTTWTNDTEENQNTLQRSFLWSLTVPPEFWQDEYDRPNTNSNSPNCGTLR